MLVDPFAAGQFEDFLFIERRQGGEVEGVEVLEDAEGGLLDPSGQGVARSGGDLEFSESEQVLLIALLAGGRFASQLLALG